MNKFLAFFLIFAVSFVLLPYCATIGVRRDATPAIAQVNAPEQQTEQTLQPQSETDKIVCRICSLSEYLTEDESIKAAAVALRTKELYDAKNGVTTEDENFYGTELPSKEDCVRLYGEDTVNRIEKLVKECNGKTITYDGEPINAQIHIISAGKTESVGNAEGDEIPYLKSVESEADKTAKGYITEKKIKVDEVKRMLEKGLKTTLSGSETEWVTEIKRTKAGAVIGAKVGGEQNDGETLRRVLGLRSPNFSYRIKNGEFIFTVKGYGNLAGMSLFGANEMAKEGKSYEQIITYYYSGTEIE